MPCYEYMCHGCGEKVEKIQSICASSKYECPSCNGIMNRMAGSIAVLKINGMFPARKEWMDNWTPSSPGFSTGSQHGARY